MSTPYKTGCKQHCNDGSDCSEKVTICTIVNAKRPARIKWTEAKPISFRMMLVVAFILGTSAAVSVASIVLAYSWIYEQFIG